MPKFSAVAAVAAVVVSAAVSMPAQRIELVSADTTPAIQVPKAGVSMDISAIDKGANPCQDFYAYACGNWRKSNPVPADKTRWGRFNELAEHNLYTEYRLMEQAANAPKSPLQAKYGSYYAACMNQPLADQLGTKPIEPLLKSIDAWNDKTKLPALNVAVEKARGNGFFYRFESEQDQKDSTKQIAEIDQAGLSLPDRDYYLQDDARMRTIREQYIAHVTKMFVLLGDTPERAAAEAKSVMTIETALAKGSMPRVDRRTPANVYHIMTVEQLEALTPGYSWGAYFAGLQRPVTQLNVATPDFFKAMSAQLQEASVAVLKSYMRWHVAHQAAPNLSTALDDENFNFFQKTLTGQKEQAPRWKRCTQGTDRALGEAVGQDWVNANFPPAAKQNMQLLVTDVTSSLGKDIDSLDWMSTPTKGEAQKKLAAFRQKIGYPEVWRDYSKMDVKRDDRVGNAQRATVFEQNRELDKIGKPVDEKEWGMTPPTVNAYYNPAMNDINFPAGILQPPFYDFKIDPAVNFGAIGVVIGHEMTHGFDDQGSQYDAQGNVRSWWTAEDRKKFEERTDCEVKEYGAFEPVPGQTLNGKLTLGENTADNGGLRVAYAAMHTELAKKGPEAATKKVDGYTPDQRFFLAFAQVWCENTTEESARVLAKTDPHSPGQYRTDGSVQNFDKFGEAFGCKKGDPMFPANSCRVW